MTMKRCSKCREEKPLEAFHRNARRKDGRHPYCKPCMREVNRQSEATRRAEKPEDVKSSYKKWFAKNVEAERARSKAWKDKNKDATRHYARQYQLENVPAVLANNAKRRAAKLQRTIKLSPEHEAELKRIYASAKHISEKTKIPHHVDHIVPLQGKEMTGLHVPWNLQVIAASNNLAKSNKVDYSRALPTCMDRVYARD